MTASPNSLETLLIQEDNADILDAALEIAQAIGLPVSSWQTGDPTRSLFMLESQILAAWESVVVGYISSGFLDYSAEPLPDGSTNPWLAINAKQTFNYDVPQATYAETTVTLTNIQGGIYEFDPGDLEFTLSSAPGVTYHNTTGGTITGTGTPGATLDVDVIADQPGTASNAGAGEIDTLVTAFAGLTCTNATAAVATDQQDATTVVQQCRNKQASFSPNGPAGAYSFVALNPALTGIQTVTRCRVYPSSSTGQVTIYVAGAGGALDDSDVAAVQSAIEQWATPLCITPTTLSATAVVADVTYSVWLYQSVNQTVSQVQAAILTALEKFFAARPIGGDIIPPATSGALSLDMLMAVIGSVFPGSTFRVQVTVPTADVALGNGDVPVLGSVTGTVTLVPTP